MTLLLKHFITCRFTICYFIYLLSHHHAHWTAFDISSGATTTEVSAWRLLTHATTVTSIERPRWSTTTWNKCQVHKLFPDSDFGIISLPTKLNRVHNWYYTSQWGGHKEHCWQGTSGCRWRFDCFLSLPSTYSVSLMYNYQFHNETKLWFPYQR